MKTKVLSFFLMTCFSVQVLAVDVVKVNQVVAEILNEIVATDDFVENLEIKLDENKTNLEKPSIGVSISAATKQAVWSDELTSLTATLDVDTLQLEDSDDVKVFGFLSGHLETDVVPFAKHMLGEGVCEVLDFDMDFEAQSPTCLTLSQEIQDAETFSDQINALSKAFEGFKAEINVSLAKLKSDLDAETDEDEKRYIGYEIESLEDSLKIFESVVIANNNGKLVVELKFDDIFGENSTRDLLSLNIEVTESHMMVKLNFEVYVPAQELAAYASLPAQIIQLLEADTEDSRQQVSSFAQGYIWLLKSVVSDEQF